MKDKLEKILEDLVEPYREGHYKLVEVGKNKFLAIYDRPIKPQPHHEKIVDSTHFDRAVVRNVKAEGGAS